MTRTYFVTEETAAWNEEAANAIQFTNKKDARKAIAKRIRDGKHFACYIYTGEQRADNGHNDALRRIMANG